MQIRCVVMKIVLGKRIKSTYFRKRLKSRSPSVSDEAAKFLPVVKCNRADSRNESGIPGEWIAPTTAKKSALVSQEASHALFRAWRCVHARSLPFLPCKKKEKKKFKIADQRKDIFDSRYSRRRRGQFNAARHYWTDAALHNLPAQSGLGTLNWRRDSSFIIPWCVINEGLTQFEDASDVAQGRIKARKISSTVFLR